MTIEEERFSHRYIIAEMYLRPLLHLEKCSLLKFFYLKVLPIVFSFIHVHKEKVYSSIFHTNFVIKTKMLIIRRSLR